MFQPNYCKHMIKSSTLLATAYAMGSLIFVSVAALTFWGLSQKFVWEFIWISVISLFLAHLSRIQCLREIRTRRLFLRYYADATTEPKSKRPACTAKVIGQN